jgi:DNA primase
MHGKVVGHIYGLLTKRDKALGPSYINSPGAWVKKALFPYDFVHNIFRQEKNASLPLCIVEGPRDALNLLQYGVPAVAILGCSNWAKTLIPSVLACRSKAVVILMDGDQAGQDAAEVIYKDLQAFLPKKGLYKFRLPVNVDPANLTQTQLETLLNYFNRIQTT